MIVPECNNYRQKITTWPEPIVKFPQALEVSELAWLKWDQMVVLNVYFKSFCKDYMKQYM